MATELPFWHHLQRTASVLRGHLGGHSRKGGTRLGLSRLAASVVTTRPVNIIKKRLDQVLIEVFPHHSLSTPYTMTYQRQGRTPPPGAVSSYHPRRLLHIGTLSFRRYHDRNADLNSYIQNLS